MDAPNLFAAIPPESDVERFETLLAQQNLKIERIISYGQRSPASGWYDQAQSEWVVVLKGAAQLEFKDGTTCPLAVGSYVNIPAHTPHRVTWTTLDSATVWLAIHYDPDR
ncbi:MAG: cupin domain-containing protein [Cyanobacteria bacterium P01_G01_bin.54]